MLKESLYQWKRILAKGNGEYTVNVTLNPAHEIFSGHFPQHPVLPGVCILEMLKEIINEKTGLSYIIAEAANIKYLKLVDPDHNSILRFEIATKGGNEGLRITATTFLSNGEINFKFKGLFVEKK